MTNDLRRRLESGLIVIRRGRQLVEPPFGTGGIKYLDDLSWR